MILIGTYKTVTTVNKYSVINIDANVLKPVSKYTQGLRKTLADFQWRKYKVKLK